MTQKPLDYFLELKIVLGKEKYLFKGFMERGSIIDQIQNFNTKQRYKEDDKATIKQWNH